MCHKFQENKCGAQHLPEYCSKGWHVRQNDRRASTWQDASSTPEPIRKKRRRGNDASAKRSETEREREVKLELRLRRLGFYHNELPSLQELETAYRLYKITVDASAIANEEKQLKIKKLRSAFTNISKAIQGQDPSPSATDSEDASLETESATEQAG
jgi:hypothetical protein